MVSLTWHTPILCLCGGFTRLSGDNITKDKDSLGELHHCQGHAHAAAGVKMYPLVSMQLCHDHCQ